VGPRTGSRSLLSQLVQQKQKHDYHNTQTDNRRFAAGRREGRKRADGKHSLDVRLDVELRVLFTGVAVENYVMLTAALGEPELGKSQ